MVEFDWFEDDQGLALSDAQRAFLAALRVRARSWPYAGKDTQLLEPSGAGDDWIAILDVNSGLTIGVCFDDTSIRTCEVHNQNYHPLSERRSRVELVQATATPEHLAGVAADWFEAVMHAPVAPPRRQIGC